MKKRSGFEKRLKRRIIGPEHFFFAICPPGLEALLHQEIIAAGVKTDQILLEKGGISFKTKLANVMHLNLHAASASRILMRIARFHADAFSKLENELKKIEWLLYLKKETRCEFKITARKSRLYHSDAIEQRFKNSIAAHFAAKPAGKEPSSQKNQTLPEQTLFVRAEKDKFIVSVDTSGTLLFKRGIKRKVAHAPLRENLAFAVLEWAGFKENDILIDPMCGSGTFSLEAARIKSRLAPGLFRTFAFEMWPAFSAKAFNHMKKTAWQSHKPPGPDPEIFAFDLDAKNTWIAQENFASQDFSSRIQVACQDFFTLKPEKIIPGRKGVIVLNPPYGKRLENPALATSLFRQIGQKLKSDFKGWRFGIVIPDPPAARALKLNLDLKPIFHGGLDLFAGIGVI